MGLMDGLSGWLRQVIAAVLLASLVDLLLPNRTMQRYVRLVAGLFILMTVAMPVLNWMKGDFGSRLAEGLLTVERSPQGAADQLALIEAEGGKLRNRHDMQAAELVSAKLAAEIASDVESSENRGVRKVDVKTETSAAGGLTVSKVVVVLAPERDAEASPADTKRNEIAPIADVDISIDVETWPRSRQPAGADEAAMAPSGEEPETQRRIAALIAGRFGIAADLVEVKVTTTDAGSKN